MTNGMDFHLDCEVLIMGQSPRQLRLARPVGSQVQVNVSCPQQSSAARDVFSMEVSPGISQRGNWGGRLFQSQACAHDNSQSAKLREEILGNEKKVPVFVPVSKCCRISHRQNVYYRTEAGMVIRIELEIGKLSFFN